MKINRIITLFFATVTVIMCSCVDPNISNTGRTAVQEMLLDTAISNGVGQLDFEPYVGKKIYLELSKLNPQIYKEVLIAAIEKRLYEHECVVVSKPEEADYTMVFYCGTLATDNSKFIIGLPPLPIPVPQSSLEIVTPELPLFKRIMRRGYLRLHGYVLTPKEKKHFSSFPEINSRSDYENWIICLFPFSFTDNEIGESGTWRYRFFE